MATGTQQRLIAGLTKISQQLRQVFDALDTGNGDLADLVSGANKLSAATAAQRPALEASVRELPAVLEDATAASSDISRLSSALTPVASDLRRSAPQLNEALDQLPDASTKLRSVLPPLRAVLDHAPDTLRKVPEFGENAREFFPPGVRLVLAAGITGFGLSRWRGGSGLSVALPSAVGVVEGTPVQLTFRVTKNDVVLSGVTVPAGSLVAALLASGNHDEEIFDEPGEFDIQRKSAILTFGNALRDLNPMLAYLKPYGKDISQFFTHFGAVFHHYGDDGLAFVYVRPAVSAEEVRPNPVKLPSALFPANPYPAPGGLRDLRPFSGSYPRVERDGQ